MYFYSFIVAPVLVLLLHFSGMFCVAFFMYLCIV